MLRRKRGGTGCGSEVKHLCCMCGALEWILGTESEREKRGWEEGERWKVRE